VSGSGRSSEELWILQHNPVLLRNITLRLRLLQETGKYWCQMKAPAQTAHADLEKPTNLKATGSGKLLEFAMILREWDWAEKGGPNPGKVDCICQPEH
jgi:hypothetical protein